MELRCQIWKIVFRLDHSLQRAPGQLSKNFQHQLSPSGELVPPVRDGVQLLRVGQQHLLGSVPQLVRVERVPQNESTGKEVQSNDIAWKENLSTMLVVLRVSTSHCSQSLFSPGTT